MPSRPTRTASTEPTGIPTVIATGTRTAAALEAALPAREWDAVSNWLSTFYPFQLEWLLDWERFALLVKARQIGASHTYAAAAMLWAMLGETTTIISRDYPGALEVTRKAKKHAQALQQLGSKWACFGRDIGKDAENEVEFRSGGRLVAYSSENAGRGMSGNIVLDEFAYHQHPAEVWDAAAAVVLHGYRMRVLSTPNGVGNLFHRLWHDGKAHAGYRLHRVTLDEAINAGLRVNLDECWRMARGDPRVFDQLFRCSFLDAEEQYISTSLIQEASELETAQTAGTVYAGLDIGLTNDLTALCVVRLDAQGVRWVQEVETCKRTSWQDQEELIARSYKRWRWTRFCVDSTGLGAVPAQNLVRRYGSIVEPVAFTQKSKEDLATTLYAHFAQKRIRIPTADAALRDDLCSLRRIITSAGNVRYDAERNESGHADRAWALALALHAASRPTTRYGFTSLDPA